MRCRQPFTISIRRLPILASRSRSAKAPPNPPIPPSRPGRRCLPSNAHRHGSPPKPPRRSRNSASASPPRASRAEPEVTTTSRRERPPSINPTLATPAKVTRIRMAESSHHRCRWLRMCCPSLDRSARGRRAGEVSPRLLDRRGREQHQSWRGSRRDERSIRYRPFRPCWA